MKRTPATQSTAEPLGHAESKAPLTRKQQRFVDEYLTDLNATQAAIRAGYSAHTAQMQSSRLLSKAMVQAAVSKGRAVQQDRTQVSADRVVLEAWHIATADPRELVEVRVRACPECWKQQPSADPATDRMPDPSCTECWGDGKARVVLHDLRTLSPAAASLYAGAKQTKYGIEIQMHSKLDAMEKLARHLGLYERDNQQKNDPLASLLHAIAEGNGNGFKPVADNPERASRQTVTARQPKCGRSA